MTVFLGSTVGQLWIEFAKNVGLSFIWIFRIFKILLSFDFFFLNNCNANTQLFEVKSC